MHLKILQRCWESSGTQNLGYSSLSFLLYGFIWSSGYVHATSEIQGAPVPTACAFKKTTPSNPKNYRPKANPIINNSRPQVAFYRCDKKKVEFFMITWIRILSAFILISNIIKFIFKQKIKYKFMTDFAPSLNLLEKKSIKCFVLFYGPFLLFFVLIINKNSLNVLG